MTKKLTKRQHYVPQFYLRNFTSDDNKLWIFDREKKEYYHSAPKDICFEKFLYETPWEDANPKLGKYVLENQIEDYFAGKEGEYSPLLESPLDEIYKMWHVNRVPVIIGVTYNDLLVTAEELMNGSSRMEQSCVTWGIMQENAGGPDVYVYNFCRQLPGDAAGAFHSAELWYMFGTYKHCWRPLKIEDEHLSDRMVTYWTEFMKKGNPNQVGLPEWYPCQQKKPFVMKLDVEI